MGKRDFENMCTCEMICSGNDMRRSPIPERIWDMEVEPSSIR